LTSNTSPSYLVELLNPLSGEVEETDVFARLGPAVEKVYLHLQGYPEVEVSVEVSHDEDDEIEGVGFFDKQHEFISCITIYRLERDTAEPTVEAIRKACLASGDELQARLNTIFNN
jgi:hypothetical protein